MPKIGGAPYSGTTEQKESLGAVVSSYGRGLWPSLPLSSPALWATLLDAVFADVRGGSPAEGDSEGMCVLTLPKDAAPEKRFRVALSVGELWRTYLPIASMALERAAATPQQRVLVGVAGAAGSGKTTSSHVLAAVINAAAAVSARAGAAAAAAGGDCCGVLSMDGYHLPNAVLRALLLRRWVMRDGRQVEEDVPGASLMHAKGRQDTIDVDAFYRALDRLLHNPTDTISLPVYDRDIHEPVENAVTMTEQHRIIVVEGLWLLHGSSGGVHPDGQQHPKLDPFVEEALRERATAAAVARGAVGDDGAAVPRPASSVTVASRKWARVRELLTLSVFLRIAPEVSKARVVARKVAHGRDAGEAAAHFERVDLPTLRTLEAEAPLRATIVLSTRTARGGAAQEQRATDYTVSFDDSDGDAGANVAAFTGGPEADAARGLRPPKVLVVGLNPAVQRTQCVAHFRQGAVNRAVSDVVSVGGKGQQFATALACAPAVPATEGGEDAGDPTTDSAACPNVVLAQVLQGRAGDEVEGLLKRRGVHDTISWRPTSQEEPDADVGDTRTCTTIICEATGEVTEVVGVSQPVDEGDATRGEFLEQCADKVRTGAVDAVAIMGSCPKRYASFYSDLAAVAAEARGDTGAARMPVLLDCAVAHGEATLRADLVSVLKINMGELAGYASMCGVGDAAELSRDDGGGGSPLTRVQQATRAAAALFAGRRRLQWVAVTDGPHLACLFRRPEASDDASAGAGADAQPAAWYYVLPQLRSRARLNPIGAGDAVAAVTLYAAVLGAPMPTAFRWGLAAGSASCFMGAGERRFHWETVRGLFARTVARRVVHLSADSAGETSSAAASGGAGGGGLPTD